jgi:hypothetical protein
VPQRAGAVRPPEASPPAHPSIRPRDRHFPDGLARNEPCHYDNDGHPGTAKKDETCEHAPANAVAVPGWPIDTE